MRISRLQHARPLLMVETDVKEKYFSSGKLNIYIIYANIKFDNFKAFPPTHTNITGVVQIKWTDVDQHFI